MTRLISSEMPDLCSHMQVHRFLTSMPSLFKPHPYHFFTQEKLGLGLEDVGFVNPELST